MTGVIGLLFGSVIAWLALRSRSGFDCYAFVVDGKGISGGKG